MRLVVFLASASLVILAACGTTHTPLKKVEARAPIKISANSSVNPIQVRPVAVNLKFNEQWGETGKGPGCLVHWPGNTLNWRPENKAGFSRAFTAVLLRELKEANYSVALEANAEKPIYSESNVPGARSAEDGGQILIIGAVKKITLNVCYPYAVDTIVHWSVLAQHGVLTDSDGAAYVQAEWQISFNAGHETTYSLITEGVFEIETSAPGNERRLLANAFAVAVRNLLADRTFHTLTTGTPKSGHEEQR